MITDWTKAKELAQKENKQILVILTGSEWCTPCKKMDKNVINNPEFEKYVEKNLVVFLIDLPGGGLVLDSEVYQDYVKFRDKYQSNALPSLILTQNDGEKIKTLKGKLFKLDNVLRQLKSR
jgi:thioredoxin-related protein